MHNSFVTRSHVGYLPHDSHVAFGTKSPALLPLRPVPLRVAPRSGPLRGATRWTIAYDCYYSTKSSSNQRLRERSIELA